MTDLFTARQMTIGKAPARIDLLGDKTKRPEPGQHIITFPGGAIELSRTAEGDYWAHILVNQDYWLDSMPGRLSALGEVVDSRIDRSETRGIDPIPDTDGLRQIAVLIRPHRNRPQGTYP